MTQNKDDLKANGDPLQEAAAEKVARRILLAEDNDEMRRLLARALCETGYEVTECRHGMDLVKHLEALILDKDVLDYELIISDILMPGLTGLEILEELYECKGFPPMILITAFGDEGVHARARKFGAAAMFDKPFEIDDLLSKVREIVPPKQL